MRPHIITINHPVFWALLFYGALFGWTLFRGLDSNSKPAILDWCVILILGMPALILFFMAVVTP